ncbi:Ig-like domain-containing protein [Gordonia sp. p3-SID1431]|uniref:L,D-transpeptidase n=1 Tax=Gordonia sp. p3-SID1431 TaxID=2916159 RepID=UPI0021A4BC76|nr:Ig-like domain-containing protein [Gordonia sp. p3-SID1431]MCT1352964.1 Ig-like domain-containing protein [Gordonia sp. p3-SID1431]
MPLIISGVMLAIVALVTSCTQEASYSDNVSSSSLFDDLLKPGLEITEWAERPLNDNAVGVQPGAPIKVKTSEGTISRVLIKKSDGTPVKGTLADNDTVWVSNEALGYNRTYTLETDAVGIGGAVTKKVTFTTSSPNNLTQAYLTPSPGETVGIGQPVAVKFDEPIADRRAAQRAIRITTDPPVEGAFYWISPSEVRWRPAEYWKPGTKVRVAVNTYGIYLVSDKHDHIIMDSSTYGVPVNSSNGYRTPVDYATRMSYSGIFFHSAPWSVWAQGNTNTSHGCLNLSPENALWVMENTLRGDPVIVKNTTGGTLSGTDGLGDWNIPWSVWRKGNADNA